MLGGYPTESLVSDGNVLVGSFSSGLVQVFFFLL